MKKFLALILALVMVLSLAACGSSESSDTEENTDAQTTEATESTDTQASADTQTSDTSLWKTVTRSEVPDLAGTTWSFSGGCVNGSEMTQEELNTALSTNYGGKLQFVFADDTNVSMVQGGGTLNGTYAADPDQENCIDITVPDKNLTYACIFTKNTDGVSTLIAIPQADGLNGIYFSLVG